MLKICEIRDKASNQVIPFKQLNKEAAELWGKNPLYTSTTPNIRGVDESKVNFLKRERNTMFTHVILRTMVRNNCTTWQEAIAALQAGKVLNIDFEMSFEPYIDLIRYWEEAKGYHPVLTNN